jgi:hypothetical protein
MIERALIPAQNAEVTRAQIELFDNCTGYLFELLFGTDGRVEGVTNPLKNAHATDAIHADHQSGSR